MGNNQTRIIDFEPEFVKLLHDRSTYELIKDENHKTVLIALREQPLTVKELVTKYEKISGQLKSDKTMYRYLNNLQDGGLVTVAGQLVTKGKKTNETIYARTATIFHLYPIKALAKKTEKLNRIARGVSLLLNPDNPDEAKIKEKIIEFEEAIQDAIDQFGDSHRDKLDKYFEKLDPYEIEKIMELSSIFFVLDDVYK